MKIQLSNELKTELKSLDKNELKEFKEFINESLKARDTSDLMYNNKVRLSKMGENKKTYLARISSKLRVVFDLNDLPSRKKEMKVLDIINVKY